MKKYSIKIQQKKTKEEEHQYMIMFTCEKTHIDAAINEARTEADRLLGVPCFIEVWEVMNQAKEAMEVIKDKM